MAPIIVAATRAVEMLQIHLAVCRDRRGGLVCATCTELDERAERAARLVSASSPLEAA